MPLRDHFRSPLKKTAICSAISQANGGVATAVWLAAPVVRVETELPDDDEYEVRVYDTSRGRRLLAAIEIVSPANKVTHETWQ